MLEPGNECRDTMRETITLPAELRRCRRCGGQGMRAVGSARGGGWSGTGIRFLYRCPDCQAEAVFDTASGRAASMGAGALLIAACALLLVLVHPSPLAVVLLLAGIAGGIWLSWSARATERRHPVTGAEAQTVPVAVDPIFPGEDRGKRRIAYVLAAVVAAAVLFLIFEASADEASDKQIFLTALADFHRGCECAPIVQAIDRLALNGGRTESAAAASTLYGWMSNFARRCADTDMLRPDVVAEALYDRAEAMRELGSEGFANLPSRAETIAWEHEAQKYLWFMAAAERGDPWAMSLVVRGYALSGLNMMTAYTGGEWRERYKTARERLRSAPRPSYALTDGGRALIASQSAWEAFKDAVLDQADQDYRYRKEVRSHPHAGLDVRAVMADHPLVAAAGPEPETRRCAD